MIYIEMSGRLGNQLFRYSFGRKLQELCGEEMVIDFKRVYEKGDELQGWKDNLKLFKVKNYETVSDRKDIFYRNATLMQILLYVLYKLGNKMLKKNRKRLMKYQLRMQPILNKYNLYFLELGFYRYDFSYLEKTKLKYICGCFESDKFFSDIQNKLLNEIQPIKPKEKKNELLYEKIENTNSVCVTIRRGDFVSNKKNKKLYDICSIEYYKKAIQMMREKIGNPTFIMFSDDIQWVKENIKVDGVSMYYEDGTDSLEEKLRLMYSCKNFIISNSTFSWWAQFLSRNEHKIVISPSKWYNEDIVSTLINEEWIKIDTDEIQKS